MSTRTTRSSLASSWRLKVRHSRMSATLPWGSRRVTGFLRHGVIGLDQVEPTFLLNPQPLPARTAYEWGVVAEVVPNGKAVTRARELADLYLRAPEVTRRNTRIHFIQPLKERIVREVGYGLSLEGASSADLVKSKRSKG
jgi:enoyl-CoA hydratase/carnithine racemase